MFHEEVTATTPITTPTFGAQRAAAPARQSSLLPHTPSHSFSILPPGGGNGGGGGGGGAAGGGGASEKQFHQRSLETVRQQNNQLAGKLAQLERENRDLKKSVHNLASFLTDPSSPAAADRILPQRNISQTVSSPVLGSIVTSSSYDNLFDLVDSPIETSNFTTRESRSLSNTSPQYANKITPREIIARATFKEHSAALYCVKFSPTGRMLASGSLDKLACIRSVPDALFGPEALTQFKPMFFKHYLHVTDAIWSLDEQRLATTSFDGRVRVWDVSSGLTKPLQSVSTTNYTPLLCGAFLCESKDEEMQKLIAVGSSSGIIPIVDFRTGSIVANFHNDARVQSLIDSHKSTQIVTGDSNGNLKIWDLRKPSSTPESVVNLCSSPGISHISKASHFVCVNTFSSGLQIFKGSQDGWNFDGLQKIAVLEDQECKGVSVKCGLAERAPNSCMALCGSSRHGQPLLLAEFKKPQENGVLEISKSHIASHPQGRVYAVDSFPRPDGLLVVTGGNDFLVQMAKIKL
eukprot:TRINITY_DN13629_c0_g2_i1.p1 TRINITY_DN13629_c0_g2~~TRINITY_DN13629_c0_g2_i1.p1  ORF type:complete len:520 (+),score=81.74 TRINITY_DN13629_c0_g2_i1:82-1641(+)